LIYGFNTIENPINVYFFLMDPGEITDFPNVDLKPTTLHKNNLSAYLPFEE
jgi:hypothetical protein